LEGPRPLAYGLRVGVRELEVAGHGGRSVPCVFFEEGRERVAVVFPGAISSGGRLGGAPSRPDLSYTRVLLLGLGFAVLEVWWDAATMPDEGEPWLRDNALAALAAAREWRVRLLVCRSLGTGVIAVLDHGWDETPAVLVAPVSTSFAAIERRAGSAFVVIGDRDERYDAGAVERWRAAGKEVVVVPGGNHALEVDDPARSARLLADVLDRMRAWIVRGLSEEAFLAPARLQGGALRRPRSRQ
jgi:pimeloyl-ACP methyl ester carboxylesterase